MTPNNFVVDICEKANPSFFLSLSLTMQLCMQRYGHKTYDVIRVQCRITTRLCKKMTNKKGKNHKIIFIASLYISRERTEAKSC